MKATQANTLPGQRQSIPLGGRRGRRWAATGLGLLAMTVSGLAGWAVGWGSMVTPDVPSCTFFTQIAAGGAHNLALTSAGQVVAWGSNWRSLSEVPAELNDVVAVAAGAWHNVALRRDGTLVAWGDFTPMEVPLTDVVAVDVGNRYSVALRANGTVVTLGNLRVANSPYVPQPEGLDDVVSIAAGGQHVLALRRDGTVVAWGDNCLLYTSPSPRDS